jgi:hypothetical protein
MGHHLIGGPSSVVGRCAQHLSSGLHSYPTDPRFADLFLNSSFDIMDRRQ